MVNQSDNDSKVKISFMRDSTEKDGHGETIMDYVVSWTLRRAQNVCKNDTGKENLYQYSRRLLGLLIKKNIKDEDLVVVETWKQEKQIDLWVYINVNGEEHDVLIEDKYYTNLHDEQLQRYRTYFDSWIAEHRPNSTPHYVVLTCKDEKEEFLGFGFDVYSWSEMLDAMSDGKKLEESGSDIFDEFWINW